MYYTGDGPSGSKHQYGALPGGGGGGGGKDNGLEEYEDVMPTQPTQPHYTSGME